MSSTPVVPTSRFFSMRQRSLGRFRGTEGNSLRIRQIHQPPQHAVTHLRQQSGSQGGSGSQLSFSSHYRPGETIYTRSANTYVDGNDCLNANSDTEYSQLDTSSATDATDLVSLLQEQQALLQDLLSRQIKMQEEQNQLSQRLKDVEKEVESFKNYMQSSAPSSNSGSSIRRHHKIARDLSVCV